jgi:hypothetical protein
MQQVDRLQTNRALVRDAALARISRTRRWMLAGAAALTAGLAALASALLPGKSFGAGSRSTAQSTRAIAANSPPPLPAPANAAQLGISSAGSEPAPVPQPQPSAPAPAPAISGDGGGTTAVSGGS